MKKLFAAIFVGIFAITGAWAQTNVVAENSVTNVETIIAIRHGEKPKGGLGQLTVKGLNRALALPDVLIGKYGTPQFIFAPNPSEKVDGAKYFYVRPLVTIEPTAIRCGLPINTEFGYLEIEGLENELAKPQYANATVFVAWEHGLLDEFGKDMVRKPRWQREGRAGLAGEGIRHDFRLQDHAGERAENIFLHGGPRRLE